MGLSMNATYCVVGGAGWDAGLASDRAFDMAIAETAMTPPGARRAGLPNPFCLLFAARRPQIGFRAGSRFGLLGPLAAALVLLALAAVAPQARPRWLLQGSRA